MNTEGPREGSIVAEGDGDRRAPPAGQEPGRLADAPNNRSTPGSAPTGEALTDEQKREAFASAMAPRGYKCRWSSSDGWDNTNVFHAWNGWSAARAALSTHPSAPAAPPNPVAHVVWGRDGWPTFTSVDKDWFDSLEATGNTPLYTHPPAVQPVAPAVRDVLAERQRQISAEGWTPEHDDEHRTGAMAAAAACYALHAVAESAGTSYGRIGRQEAAQRMWPWDFEWWKPSLGNPRRDLIKAGALILAEIERLDRAATPSAEAQPTPKEN